MKKQILLGLSLVFGMGFGIASSANIGDVQLRFCNEGVSGGNIGEREVTKNLSLQMSRGEKQNLCMQFTNLGAEKISLQYNFVDGTVTNGAMRNKACQDEAHVEQFGRYVSGDKAPFSLAPGQTIEKRAEIIFDGNAGGEINGCVTFFEAQEGANQQSGMFKMFVRRANFVDVLLDGDVFGSLVRLDARSDTNKNYSPNPKIFFGKSNEIKGHEILLSFKNDGSISQSFHITGTMKNLFGQERIVLDQEKELFVGNTLVVKELVDSVPWYGGFVTLKFDVVHQVVLNFANDDLDPGLLDSHVMAEEARFFLFTWWLILFVVLFLVMVYCVVYLWHRHRHHIKEKKRSPHAYREGKKIKKQKEKIIVKKVKKVEAKAKKAEVKEKKSQ